MATTHLKRIASPRSWPVHRKENAWILKPRGAISKDFSLSITFVFTKLLGFAKTAAEARKILLNKTVLLNGKQIKDKKAGFGLFDVLSIKEIGKSYTLIINNLDTLEVKELDSKESSFKLSKIIGKTNLPGKKIQLNLHDGINLLISKDDYKTGDTVILNLSDLKIKDKILLEKGCLLYLIKGKHTGNIATATAFSDGKITCKVNGLNVDLVKEQIIVIGKSKPVLSIFSETNEKKPIAEKKSETKE